MKKQNRFWTCPLIALGLVLMLTSSCKKEEEEKVPILTTAETTSITPTTATSGGSITSDGGAAITERGVCYGTTQSPNTANSRVAAAGTIGSFTCSLVGLTPATTYYVRAYATNSAGTAYGDEISFTTIPLVLPTLTTTTVSAITITTATSGGSVTSDGGAAITERGVCYGTTQSPNTANSKVIAAGTTGSFACSLVGLAPATTYYARAYATNSVGTAYGSQVSFTTFEPNAITDVDGNIYNTITIGIQTWMKENLKTTKYRNGEPISNITDNAAWIAQTAGAYCWYNNDAATYKSTYGALYNWYAVVDTRNLCPTGWHLPTDDEWTTLTDYLGGEAVAGGKLKEIGTTHWASPNTGADNTTGFSALPGGIRDGPGYFYNIGGIGYWWSSSEYTYFAWHRSLQYNDGNVHSQVLVKNCGNSVRCVKNKSI